MKKKHHNRTLGRTATGRKALFRNLIIALLERGSIVTTETKAKEFRLICEPLITKAKLGPTVVNRRYLLSALDNPAAVAQILKVGEGSKKRPGGYLRLTRMPKLRQDATRMMRIDFVDGSPA